MWSYVIEFIDNYDDMVSIIVNANCQKTAVELFKNAFPRWEIINVYVVE